MHRKQKVPSRKAIKKAAAQEKLRRRVEAARENFEAFILNVWANEPEFQLADFHREAIEKYCDFSIKFLYWEAARGHFKSGLTLAFVVWCLGRDPNHRIKLICANDKEARKRLSEIAQHIEKNKMLHLVFPHLKKETATEWNKSRITIDRELTSKDPSIEALGVMSGSLGSRATIIIFDDIVDMRNAILQPQLREHVRKKVFGEILPLLEPEGFIRAVGTPWTLNDVNAIMKESEAWVLVGPHRVGKEGDKFVPIWIYKFTRQLLIVREEAQGPAEYARAYRCQALTKDTVPIQGAWIKFYDTALLGDPYKLFCLQCYDLAISQTNDADYFACVTLLWCQERNFVFVADAWRDKLSFGNQARAIVREANTWQPQEIVIESGGYQGALESHLLEESPRPLPIWMFRNRGRSKERRVVEASPFLEKGRVFFHPKFNPRTNHEINNTGNIIGELTSFPFGKHDDLVDGVVMGLLTVLELQPDSIQDQNENRQEDDGSMRLMVI